MIPSITVSRFIHAQQGKHKNSTGEFSDLLSSIVLGVKMIGQLIATAGFKGLYGYSGSVNTHGEERKELDEQADQILVELLGSSGHFGLMVSEEHDGVVSTTKARKKTKYVVAFDPLDGSTNINSNIPVGTIFTIFRRKNPSAIPGKEDFLVSGDRIVAAGYALYGPRTSFVYSCGDGVHGFTLDPSIGEFILTEEKLLSPKGGRVYSVNEGHSLGWSEEIRDFVQTPKAVNKKKGTPYSARYAGSLVADFDRNLRNGGIFLYPATVKYPKGKLRLLYECMPLAFIAENAKSVAIDGRKRILSVVPKDIHQRSQLFVGSSQEIGWLQKALK